MVRKVMSRHSNPSKVPWDLVILLGGFYYAYSKGWLRNLFPGTGSGTTTPPGTTTRPPGGVVQPPVTGGPGCDSSFIPGVRYVELRNGVYNVVIGGAVVYSSTSQSAAEQEYNRRVCGG